MLIFNPLCLQVHHLPLGQRVPLLGVAGLLQGAPLGAAPLRRLDTHGMGQDQGHRRRLHATCEYTQTSMGRIQYPPP